MSGAFAFIHELCVEVDQRLIMYSVHEQMGASS